MYTTADKVTNAARNVEIKNGTATTMTPAQANDFLQWAEDIINAKLSTVYITPLRQIVRSGITRFPAPIELIATNLAAGLMIESIYSRIEPQISESGKQHKEDAMKMLDELVGQVLVGSYALDGQDRRARNTFVNPHAAPFESNKGTQF